MESIQNLQITNQQNIQEMSNEDLIKIVKKDTNLKGQVLEFQKNYKSDDFCVDLHSLLDFKMYEETATIKDIKKNIESYLNLVKIFKKNIIMQSTNASPNPLSKYKSPQNLKVCNIYIAKCEEMLKDSFSLKSAIEAQISQDKDKCPIISILEKEVSRSLIATFSIQTEGQATPLTLTEIGYSYTFPAILSDIVVSDATNREEEKVPLQSNPSQKQDLIARGAFENAAERLEEINTNLSPNKDRKYDVKKITRLSKYKENGSNIYFFKGYRIKYPFIVEYQNGALIFTNIPNTFNISELTNYIPNGDGKVLIRKYFHFQSPLKEINVGSYATDKINEAEFYEGKVKFILKNEDREPSLFSPFLAIQYEGVIPTPTKAEGKLTFYRKRKNTFIFRDKISMEKYFILEGKWNIDDTGNWRTEGEVCIKLIENFHDEESELSANGKLLKFKNNGFNDRVITEIKATAINGLLDGGAEITIRDVYRDWKTLKYDCKDDVLIKTDFQRGYVNKAIEIEKQLPHGKIEIFHRRFTITNQNGRIISFADIFLTVPDIKRVYENQGNTMPPPQNIAAREQKKPEQSIGGGVSNQNDIPKVAGSKRQAEASLDITRLNQLRQQVPPLQRAVGIHQNQQEGQRQNNHLGLQNLGGNTQLQPPLQPQLQAPSQINQGQGPSGNTRSRTLSPISNKSRARAS